MHKSLKGKILWFLFLPVAFSASAQSPVRTLTRADYARAEKMMAYNTSPLVYNLSIRPVWIDDDHFWYRSVTPAGSSFILVNALTGKKQPVFDHSKLAEALSKATGKTYKADSLPFNTIEYDNFKVDFDIARKPYRYDTKTNELTTATRGSVESNAARGRFASASLSPNGKLFAFIRNYNLWVRDMDSKKETQLTTDGVKDYGYATDNAGWTHSDDPVLLWSPDSKKIATFRQDQRNVSDMYLVTTNVGKPTLQQWKYPLPGDKVIPTIERIIINVDEPKVIPLKVLPDPHRGTLCDDIACSGNTFGDVQWTADAAKLAFVSTSRDHKHETVSIADAATGAVTQVYQENVETQYESGRGAANWRYLAESNEFIWYSERDNWGHLYLYDANTGKLKNQITKGNWVVSRLLKVDEAKRELYFLAQGREAGQNPYFNHFYKINFDGSGLTLLDPEDGDHQVALSPSGKYFTDTYSKHDAAPVTTLRSTTGKLITELEKADISRLLATGWKMPTPITVKSRDGQFDLYGVMYTPTKLDRSKKYPIINYIYPGPQGGSVGSWSFQVAKGDNQALAELGFVVVAIEGTCNPNRSKSFHDACYGNMADNTLPDQIAGMKQLAAKYPFIDIDKAGIWGHSGGGFATAAAMFRYPDFFKVGISESGNHDNRNYEDDWGERYIGLETVDATGKSNYDDQANQNFAKNLKGKLMLAHGMLDDNVPPSNTLLVVDALIKANKDFDLVIFPNSRHGYGEFSLYMTRRRWDYFVKNLMGANPPKEYELRAKGD